MIICDCAWPLQSTFTGAWRPRPPRLAGVGFRLFAIAPGLLGPSKDAWRPRPPWLAGAGFRLFAIVPGFSRARPRTLGGRGRPGLLALVSDYLRLCLASPGYVQERLAAAATVARWRWFAIICGCAWPLQGASTDAWRPRPPWLAGAGFRLFAIVPGLSRARPRTPGGRCHLGSLALVPDYLRVCLASPARGRGASALHRHRV